jgi:hypothetical protein
MTPTEIQSHFFLSRFILDRLEKKSNGGVDAAARIQSSIAGLDTMRNTLPPLASNDLLGRSAKKNNLTPVSPT